MTCNRLSWGALALTLIVSLAGLAISSGAIATAFQHASAARHNLKATVAAGLAADGRPVVPLAAGNDDQAS